MIEFKVEDMVCGHCVNAVMRAIKRLDLRATVGVTLAERTVRVESVAPPHEIAQALVEVGYTPQVAHGSKVSFDRAPV